MQKQVESALLAASPIQFEKNKKEMFLAVFKVISVKVHSTFTLAAAARVVVLM